MIRKPRAILFDLDCTLIDRGASLHAYSRRFQEHFVSRLRPCTADDLLDEIRDADGGGYTSKDKAALQLAGKLPWRSAVPAGELLAFWEAHWPSSTCCAVDAIQTLARLASHDVPLGIVTNGRAAVQNAKIGRLGLDRHARCVVISETVGVKKPDPAIFHAAATALNIPVEDVWFVGDHPVNDILGAARAGMTPIWLRGIHPWPPEQAEPLLAVDALAEVVTLFEQRRAMD